MVVGDHAQAAALVENLLRSTCAADRAVACEVVLLSPCAPAIAPLRALLNDPDPQARLALCRALAAFGRSLRPAHSAWAAFDALLAHAAETYPEHRLPALPGALLAAARSPGPEVRRILTDTDQPIQMTLRAALRRARFEGARAAAVACLAFDPLASAALDRLTQTDDVAEHELALRAWPLLINPARRRRIARATPGVLAPAHFADSLSDEARLGLVKWCVATPMRPAERRERLVALAADPCLRVSVAAERALARQEVAAGRDPARARPGARTAPGAFAKQRLTVSHA